MNDAIWRILDANLNRLREGLRVAEDYARFALDDAPLARELKTLRHGVRDVLAALQPPIDAAAAAAALLAARDTEGDIGRDVKTAAEAVRESPASVAAAALSRAAEAARVVSEFAKLQPPPASDSDAHPAPSVAAAHPAAIAEAIRYRIYELQPPLLARGELRRRFRGIRLYGILTESVCRLPWRAAAEAAVRGGVDCLQLREKQLSDGELLRRARELRELTSAAGALLIINDRPDIARLARADGIHVGQDDLSVADARRTAGGELLIGKSTHTPKQVRSAIAEAPDYIAVGPMFATTTKPQEHIAGVETLRAAAGMTDLPLVAIGGITAERAAAVRGAVASERPAIICACGAIFGSAEPEAAARALRAAIYGT